MTKSSHYLLTGLSIVTAIMIAAVTGYMLQGWSFIDSLYMVVITIFTVGYAEVQTVDSPEMKIFTMTVIISGCTGLIFLTSAFIQYLTEGQINRLLEKRKMTKEINKLENHVIICGFGRIGRMISNDLAKAGCKFIIIERNEEILNELQDLNYLTYQGDATDEDVLIHVGIKRAKTLAVTLPDDASNVFITLSARNLNSELEIIARGEIPTTKRKLLQAGATRVVLPAHIGAERIANMILFPSLSERLFDTNEAQNLENDFSELGLELDRLILPNNSPFIGKELKHIEMDSNTGFLVIAIHKNDGQSILEPAPETKLETGDCMVLICHKGIFPEIKEQFISDSS